MAKPVPVVGGAKKPVPDAEKDLKSAKPVPVTGAKKPVPVIEDTGKHLPPPIEKVVKMDPDVRNVRVRQPKLPGPKLPTASAMFKELIMRGDLTNDEIFARVKEKFGLDDKKRTYVSVYRTELVNRGKNPPPAVPKKSSTTPTNKE